ncbi:MAG TPA: segregation/condensation protein A [Terracidiphilus sp.]|nr:segregation/condensation protein A [Terracidiphilus sp.]
MEDKTVPWWRKALSYALDGIRSGFGLFSRTAKNNAAIEPEIVAGNQENPEEAELTRHSPTQEPILEAVPKAEALPVLQATVATLPDPATQAEAVPERAPVQTLTEPVPEPEPESAIEAVAADQPTANSEQEESDEEVLTPQAADELNVDGGGGFNPRIETTESPRALAPEEYSSRISPEISRFAADSQIEPVDGPAAAEDSLDKAEAPTELATEMETYPAPVESPIGPYDRMAEFEDTSEAGPEAEFEIKTEREDEPESEPDLEPEVKAIAEPEAPTAIDEHPTADEPTPESARISEELIQPVIEATLEQTAVQPVEVEIESADEVTPAPETTPVAEQAVEQATEPSPEPATTPMDTIDPIPEQVTEPSAEVAQAPVVPVEARTEAPAVALPPEPAQEHAAIPVAELPAPSAEEPAPPPPHAPKPFIKLETRDNEADLSPFSVVVSQVYDGPLDLLLDLIRKQDIDIYDIPIAQITSQFLAYVNQLKATDVDVAGEFIYTASLLIHIKSKMLLPRTPVGPDDAAEDPRRELVERLLEHERFKNAAQMLQQKQMLEAATWTNPGLREFQDDASAEPEIAADTVDLVRIFRDILERARNRPVINVQEESVTVGQMIQFLSRRLTMEDKPVALRRLLSHTRSERALIAMFLALLELVRLQAILLRQDRAFSEIFIKKHIGFETVMNDGLPNARDDWR